MMNNSLIIITLVLFAVSCGFSSKQKEDENIQEALRKIVPLISNNPDSALLLLNRLWTENGRKFTYSDKLTFHNLQGSANTAKREPIIAEQSFRNALEVAEKLNDVTKQIGTLANIAIIQRTLGNLQNSLDYSRQAQLFLKEQHDAEASILINQGLSATFGMMGQADSTLYYAQKAIDEAVKEEFKLGEAAGLTVLAALLFNFKEYLQAEEVMRKAIFIFEELEDNRNLYTAYANLAAALAAQHQFDEAMLYAERSDEFAQAIGVPLIGKFSIYKRRGELYFAENKHAGSLEMYNAALELLRVTREPMLVGSTKNAISMVHSRLGNYDEAIVYANKALDIALESNNTYLLIDIYRNMAEIYATNGNMEQFVIKMKDWETLRDSLFTRDRFEAIQALQIRYETEQKDMELSRHKEQLKNKQVIIYLIILFFIGISALMIFHHRRKMQYVARIVQQYEVIAAKNKHEISPAKNNEEQDLIKKPTTSDDVREKLSQGLEHLFEVEKIYRRQALSVDDVVEMLSTNRTYLSEVINQVYQKNFSEFVNTYRVREAAEMLKEQNKGGKYAHLTTQAILEEVGFKNKSSFYVAFKQVIGVTPSAYKMVVEKEA